MRYCGSGLFIMEACDAALICVFSTVFYGNEDGDPKWLQTGLWGTPWDITVFSWLFDQKSDYLSLLLFIIVLRKESL